MMQLAAWLLVIAFAGAGIANALGVAGTRASFVRWGYPRWWCHITGGLEIAVAILFVSPETRASGEILGAIIIMAAVITVLRARDYRHLVPLSLFGILLVLGWIATHP